MKHKQATRMECSRTLTEKSKVESLPIAGSKQLPSDNFWRLTPYGCLGILFKHMLLLVGSSEHKVPFPKHGYASRNNSESKRKNKCKHNDSGENVNSTERALHAYPTRKTRQLAIIAAVFSSTLLLKSHQP